MFRPAFAIPHQVYRWLDQATDIDKPHKLWRSVAAELAAIASLSIFFVADIGAGWYHKVYMTDASDWGYAALSADASPAAQRAEARHCDQGVAADQLYARVERDADAEGDEDDLMPGGDTPFARTGRQGMAELFGGTGRVAEACRRFCGSWVENWEIENGEECDLLNRSIVAGLMSRVRRGEFWWIRMGPPCSTFSMARFPRLRTTRFPWGVPGLKADKKLLARAGTLMCPVALEIAVLCLKHNVAFTWGNPHSSMMWNFPPVAAFMMDPRLTRFVITYCGYGTSWLEEAHSATHQLPGAAGRGPALRGLRWHVLLHRRTTPSSARAEPQWRALDEGRMPLYPLPMCKEIALAFRQRAPLVRTTNALFGTPNRADKSPAPALDPAWLEPGRWSLSFCGKWQRLGHNNVLEARGVLAVLRRVARTSRAWSSRVLVFTDSMVTAGCPSKGRSSATALLRGCRAAAAIQLVCRIRIYLRWVPSEKNLADNTSSLEGWPNGRRAGDHCCSPASGPQQVHAEVVRPPLPKATAQAARSAVPSLVTALALLLCSLSAGDARTKAAESQEGCARAVRTRSSGRPSTTTGSSCTLATTTPT